MAKYLPKEAFTEHFKDQFGSDWERTRKIFDKYSAHRLSVEVGSILWYALDQNKVPVIIPKLKKHFFSHLATKPLYLLGKKDSKTETFLQEVFEKDLGVKMKLVA